MKTETHTQNTDAAAAVEAKRIARDIVREYEAALHFRQKGSWDEIDAFWQDFLSVTPTYDTARQCVGVDLEITVGGPSVHGRIDANGCTVWVHKVGGYGVYTDPGASYRILNDIADTFEADR
jgi:hypothetical protein